MDIFDCAASLKKLGRPVTASTQKQVTINAELARLEQFMLEHLRGARPLDIVMRPAAGPVGVPAEPFFGVILMCEAFKNKPDYFKLVFWFHDHTISWC